MKKYKAIKGISVFFALITLAAVVCICLTEMVNLEMAKTWEWFQKVCEFIKIDLEDVDLKEKLLHYSTLALAVSYVFTFFFWLITFKVGAKTIGSSRRSERQAVSSEVRATSAKEIKSMQKAQAKAAKEAEKKAHKHEHKHVEKEAEVVTETKVETKTEAENKLDNILKGL